MIPTHSWHWSYGVVMSTMKLPALFDGFPSFTPKYRIPALGASNHEPYLPIKNSLRGSMPTAEIPLELSTGKNLA